MMNIVSSFFILSQKLINIGEKNMTSISHFNKD